MNDEFDKSPIRVPPEVFLLPIGAAALRVLCALCRFTDKSGRARSLGRQKLLMYLHDQDVRNMRRAVRELIQRGYLDVAHHKDQKTGADGRCDYSLRLPSLKKIREERRREKCARGGVSGTPRRVSKQAALCSTATKTSSNLKPGYNKAPRGFSPEEGEAVQRDAERAMKHFQALYAKKTGRLFVPEKLDWHSMRSLVQPGGHGLAGVLAACDLWFSAHAPWVEQAKMARYALRGSNKGMEWNLEWIMDLPSFGDKKREYARELSRID